MYAYSSHHFQGGSSFTGYSMCQSGSPVQSCAYLPQHHVNSSFPTHEIMKKDPFTEPRSMSELNSDAMASKFRQLPCRTFVSVGTCPYRERCVYLHDPRVICREAKTKTRRKNKDDVATDALFWPVMSSLSVSHKLDSNRQPHVVQSYVVNPAQNDQFKRHDQAVYSMWMYFVDMCLACSASEQPGSPSSRSSDSAPCFQAPDLPMNAYTNSPRLDVFRRLSSNHSLIADRPAQRTRSEAAMSPTYPGKQSSSSSLSSRSVSPTTVVSFASHRGLSR